MRNKYFLAACFSLLILGGVFVFQQIHFNDGKLHVTFCDVGQGDGIFIRTPKGLDIVIDGGPDTSMLSCISKHMPFWDRKIDLMILTHPHEDHYYGLIQIAKRYQVTSFVTQSLDPPESGYKNLVAALRKQKTAIRYTCQNHIFTLPDEIHFKTLWPLACDRGNAEKEMDLNTISVVQLVSFKNFQLLLTGDIDETIAAQIDDEIGDVEVLKIPHHGSATGFDTTFLDTITPELAVISVGEKNRYGHPAKGILQVLQAQSIKTMRTDQHGDITLVSDGDTYWVVK